MPKNRKIARLQHARVPLRGGGQVVVLNTGALIDAEETAMLQAKHSRSLGGIDSHLVALAKEGAARFMDQNYVGYGDKSIGDCGTATIFIEGVSMLVAKAVQDSMLYNGQESSTRYIKFEKQPFINPFQRARGTHLLESLRAFHLRGVEMMQHSLSSQYPWNQEDGEAETVWRKAINARAFDVMRAFLPAGAMTNLAWHSELRHLADHMLRLRHHPLDEVRYVADRICKALLRRFKHSGFGKRYTPTEEYVEFWMRELYYFDQEPGFMGTGVVRNGVHLERNTVEPRLLEQYKGILANRPPKTEFPKFMAECGTLQVSYFIDFGSFRDLQRQRSLVQRMPLLSDKYGFSEWYFEQMPSELKQEAIHFLADYKKEMETLALEPVVAQYYVPMGYKVPCRNTGDLPAWQFVTELRSVVHVHPTARAIAHGVADIMLEQFGDTGLILHIDRSPDRFNIKRGHHDIGAKPVAA